MDLKAQAILWAAIKQQSELRDLAVSVNQFDVAESATRELLRLTERLKDGISNSRHDS